MTMSPVSMVFALIAVSLCHRGDCSNKCLSPLPDNQMLTTTDCFAGYYRKLKCNSTLFLCEKCGKEKFMSFNNKERDCTPCSVCDGDQIAKSECTNQKDRECVCKDGLFRDHVLGSVWRCSDCMTCSNCSECPECKSVCEKKPNCGYGQFLDQKGKCQSCANHNCSNKSCVSFCKPVPESPTTWILVLGITLSILLLLGLFALCRFILVVCRRSPICCWAYKMNVNERNPGDAKNIVNFLDPPGEHRDILLPMNIIPGSALKEPGTRDLDQTGHNTAPLIINELTKHEPAKEIWPAPVLYTIIRQVPVRRWKEFLRLLSLSDDQMERVELESRGSYLEQQYQMLRLWSQTSDACLENIYSTLHHMDLSGCASDLQEKLQEILV